MNLTKQQESEVMNMYDIWWHSYINGDVKTYDSYLMMNIGLSDQLKLKISWTEKTQQNF
ncbi:MAG: hypothetical protein R3A12_16920 [Ignavibacteria bacterium]